MATDMRSRRYRKHIGRKAANRVRRSTWPTRGPASCVGWARRLVVMVKAPVAGRVKTRLARETGVAPATRFSRHVTAALLDRVGRDRRWHTMLAVTPDVERRGRFWPCRFERGAQGSGDLGKRMQRVMNGLPPGPAIIVGSDIPGIRAIHIARAFKVLGGHDAVLGPAPDGGYWLVGLKRSPRIPRPFANARWSTSNARADTLANLEDSRVALVTELEDVDNAADLKVLHVTAGRRIWLAKERTREEVEMDRTAPEVDAQSPPAPLPSLEQQSSTAIKSKAAKSMNSPTSAQVSPAQVLQSAHRAEAGGRPDYAIQFYRHLAEFYPETSEGKEARESLDRLTDAGRRPALEPGRSALFPEAGVPAPARDLRPIATGEALARLAYRGEEYDSSHPEGAAEPASRAAKSYDLGKSLARLLAGFGLFLVFAGIVFPVATLAGQHLGPFSVDVAGLPLGVLLAPIAFGLGIGMLVASQAAFAVFEHAEGLRELQGIEQSRRKPGQ